MLCLLCVGFLVFLVFILFHFFFLFFTFYFRRIFFLGFCCCCCWGLKEIYIIYISVLAASPDNLLLAFFFLFLYTIFFIYFIFMIFRMKQGIFHRKKGFLVFISSSIPALLSRLFHLTFVGNNIYVVFLFHLFCYNNNNNNRMEKIFFK